MKFKAYITNIVAILSLVVLVSGFQIQLSESDDISLEGIVGMQTAYAGPCGAAGCVGKKGYCGKEVTVIKFFDWEIDKECHGEDKSDGTKPVQ